MLREKPVLDRELLDDAMRRALTLARRSPAGDPNPQVGCVLLDPDGRIVAEGWHRGAGTPHAEVDALAQLPAEWRGRMDELTAIVTLEPCNHTGRTGPCAGALASAGIGAVAYGTSDPGEDAGGGAETLRAAGVEVVGGVRESEARAVITPWLELQALAAHTPSNPISIQPRDTAYDAGHSNTNISRTPRPFVTVKWAQTLDGRAAAADGSSQWITGPEARADVHLRRAQADAILVGTGTLLADDPSLTARGAKRTESECSNTHSPAASEAPDGLLVPSSEQPIPVVLGRRAIPADARVHQHPALAARGLAAPIHYDGTDLAAHLADLATRGVENVFVEGGPTVASAFLAAGLVDEVLVYLAPALLGGPRLAIHDLGIDSMPGILRLPHTEVVRLGDDLLIIASPVHRATDAPAASATPQRKEY
ncbi:bifunctional diaminohydroxyphosphoribosylaminopyrimidine deaminase/5-amino-6-(5-phosphoribosylamino)uracil reductase RibD [Leucobacter sp. W1478]|uniref:bifunctional diaminohydroxyphosphoribosylaminopyrimidine deaminase/5-amino-6-(5-phosphoribosylamino)uracil reductase RibD n=1 Tax=Leucobacter sp. W1478 TaxID=3439065 RepID=UPI003F2C1323